MKQTYDDIKANFNKAIKEGDVAKAQQYLADMRTMIMGGSLKSQEELKADELTDLKAKYLQAMKAGDRGKAGQFEQAIKARERHRDVDHDDKGYADAKVALDAKMGEYRELMKKQAERPFTAGMDAKLLSLETDIRELNRQVQGMKPQEDIPEPPKDDDYIAGDRTTFDKEMEALYGDLQNKPTPEAQAALEKKAYDDMIARNKSEVILNKALSDALK